MTSIDDTEDSDFVSKSQRKRDMNALQDLGKMLTEIPVARLEKVAISDNLRDALVEMQRLKANGARARQLQYIGKLMRSEDARAIRKALDQLNGSSKAETARMHRLEKFREDLLEDEAAMTHIVEALPGVDVQRLRQLRRNALKERAETRPPKAFREIFQILKEADESVRNAVQVVQEDEEDE